MHDMESAAQEREKRTPSRSEGRHAPREAEFDAALEEKRHAAAAKEADELCSAAA